MDDVATPAVPASAWEGFVYTSIHAAILYAELEDSTVLGETLTPIQYDNLINTYQRAALGLVKNLREQGMQIGETHAIGDQLFIALYDHDEVHRNYLLDGPGHLEGRERADLIAKCRSNNQNLAVSALRAAIQLKNTWLIQGCNIDRVRSHLAPWEIGIGLHYGRVYLNERPFGGRRIEGFPARLARVMQNFSSRGSYSHIMFSQRMRDVVLRSMVKHTQLRQRVFFHEHRSPGSQLPGHDRTGSVHELKFYHRIGVHVTQSVIDQYDAILSLDPSNIWAYYQLVDYFTYVASDWSRAFELVTQVRVTHPNDEKVLLDLAKYYLQQGKLSQSKLCAEEALQINDAFDLAHEHLAVLASKVDNLPAQIEHLRHAVNLSPNSAVNNFNLGLALLDSGEQEEGLFFVQQALRIYPEYKDWQVFRESLQSLKKEGKLPGLLVEYTGFEEQEA